MLTLRATPAAAAPADHGEGPTWDAARGELLWVDISAGVVRRGRPEGDDVRDTGSLHAGDTVGFAVPAAAGGWLAGAGGGFTHVAGDGTARVLVELPGEGGSEADGGRRMNDGACDRAGRLYGGTMAFDERPGAGTLYRVDTDGTVSTVLDGLTVSNGLGWSPDGGTVYLADSGPAVVHAFDHDPATGAWTNGRVLLETGGADGVADGLTVDDEGCLWTAMWGGGQVRRWSPEGELLAVVEVGVAHTSSCAFVGGLLVISTATGGDGGAGAGRLFTVRPGVAGPPAEPYRGPLTGLRIAG